MYRVFQKISFLLLGILLALFIVVDIPKIGDFYRPIYDFVFSNGSFVWQIVLILGIIFSVIGFILKLRKLQDDE